jgi:hypothetical protein
VVRIAVIGEHPFAADALAVEPGNSRQQKAHRRCLHLIRQHLDVGQTCEVCGEIQALKAAAGGGGARGRAGSS